MTPSIGLSSVLLFGALLHVNSFPTAGKGCVQVTPKQCGTKFTNNCLVCGTKSAWDCEKCCPGCSPITKGQYKYCQCSAPGPSPGPSPPSSGDYVCYDGSCYSKPGSGKMSKKQCESSCSAPGPSPAPSSGNWSNYRVAGMDVLSVTGSGNVDKIVILLHGGGMQGSDYQYQYNSGWFGDTSGLKYVFPTAPSHLWYGSTKQAGCGFCDECAYTAGSIEASATRVAALIQHELKLVGGNTSKIYLGGFSQGAQMTAYMQIAKLNFPLGGTIVMDGYPLPPVCNATTVKSAATYSGSDMNWFIYWGGADPIFPPTESLAAYHGMFNALNVSSVLKYEHTEPGMTHTLIEKEFTQMVKFIRA